MLLKLPVVHSQSGPVGMHIPGEGSTVSHTCNLQDGEQDVRIGHLRDRAPDVHEGHISSLRPQLYTVCTVVRMKCCSVPTTLGSSMC
jgi:hypothetical protein